MAVDPDWILLDRVFQPFVEACAGLTSCFGLARVALVIAVEAQGLTLFWDGVADPSVFGVTLCSAVAVLTIFAARQAWQLIRRAEKQTRSGMMNVRRISLRRQRLTWLGVCAACMALLVPQGDLRSGFALIGCAGWIALIYFVSCTPLPPARQRFRRMAPAFAPVSR